MAAARQRHGWNELPRAPRRSPVLVFARQFAGLLVLILIAAGLIALALGEIVDATAIGLVVLLNGALGFVQEWRAEIALEALRGMLSPNARVVRDGEERVIPARDLVPGDLVVLAAGDGVPADIDLMRATDLRVDESVVTGESVPVEKVPAGVGTTGGVLAGTAVAAGRAEGIVAATGADTTFGRIAELTGGAEEKQTHLQRQLGRLARQLGLIALLAAAAVAGIGLSAGRPAFEMFMIGLSLAVSVIPEGLPAVVTITLALGAAAMARRNALARRLQAVETLGVASVICTDKTGTLTENRMTAVRIWTAGGIFEVSGTGYDPVGHITRDGARFRAADDPVLGALLETAQACNHAHLYSQDGGWAVSGSPTEAALLTLAMKGRARFVSGDDAVAETPFSSTRKRMSVLVPAPGGFRLHLKGAPEVVLERSTSILTGDGPRPLDAAGRTAMRDALQQMAGGGLRVIALAARPAERGDLAEDGLTLLGLVGLIDPPRAEVKGAIAEARAAGIRVIMITGDSPVTARAVANMLDMGDPTCVTGAELERIDAAALRALLARDVLFARTLPEHKMRIVQALQAEGHVVAMTGDGVNDAPALKRADIGVAMGLRGTDVSKGAADLVLLDDNFATIVGAIEEGRRQFDNIARFVRYLMASNAGEVIAILANLLIGGPLIFLATQILWINLVTDGLTAVALGLEKAEAGQMQRPPRRRDAPILTWRGGAVIAAFGTYTAAASLALFYALLPAGEDLARSAAFAGIVVFEKASVFAFRSLTQPCSRIGWLSNPFLVVAVAATLMLQVAAIYWAPLQVLLQTASLGPQHWAAIAALALPLVLVPEAVKTLRSGRAAAGDAE